MAGTVGIEAAQFLAMQWARSDLFILRYEDLIADPEGALRRVCDFVELPYQPTMLQFS